MGRHTSMTTRQLGFTLLEIIVIIVIAGLVGALLVNLMGTQLTKGFSPATTASNAAQAEAAMENVVAYYTGRVNANLTTALDDVKIHYPASNPTVSIIDYTTSPFWNSVPALIVTTTVGQSSVTIVLTQSRTNAADTTVNY